jgi:membrane protein DedA with SNARE-associated domain
MPELIAGYIIEYGYIAIFCMVLLQESGVPGLPNEPVLFYFGFISHRCHLFYPLVTALVIVADVAGSFLLYLLFFYGSGWLARIKPTGLRLPTAKLERLKKNILFHNGRNLFIGKLTPFVRGYIPVAAGILQIHPFLYGRTVVLAAILWSGGWLTAGWIVYGMQ